ncbi:hypothetical protein A2U01_0106022 [Trifolium medium]|uniref:Uncharacterized protein n=1 Tax=Trifolium medium TaxID=97028 RepID=A0A392V8Z9_9FABA|nr:hypothetical protein [Trifolium medium]
MQHKTIPLVALVVLEELEEVVFLILPHH